MLLNRAELTERLVENVIEVHFKKVNGDLRIMHCTLKSDLIPSNDEYESQSEDGKDSHRMIVWDVEKSGWRSFRLDSVMAVLTPSTVHG
jgi:hypothetical protein